MTSLRPVSRFFAAWLLPAALVAALAAANLFWGSSEIAPSAVWRVLTGSDEAADAVRFIVVEVRLPMMLTALFAGAALSVAGLLMQTVFANPLADPGILGVNSGAALGVALVMLLFGGTFTAGDVTLSGFALVVAAAFTGAAAVIALLLFCNALLPGRLHLLVTGVMLSFIVSALIGLLSFLSTAQGVQSYVLWGLGNFSGVTLQRMPLFVLCTGVGLVGACILAKPLNAMLLGDDYARNLGVDVRRTRMLVLLLTGLLTAVTTALCGPVAFVGLAVPHAARLTLRTADHRRLLPATMLWGAALTLFCNLLSVLPAHRGMLPVNVITPLLGVPMVFFLLTRRKGDGLG